MPKDFPHAILHIDADAFFASCEQSLNPRLKGKPVVVGEDRGIATALSYEAKFLGVERGMPIKMVKRLYPQITVLPSDYESYALFSKRMFNIVKRFTNIVEEYSIDEFFADITGFDRPFGCTYVEMARMVKEAVQKELGITVSVGLAGTKVLAKIASKINKPDGFTIIPQKYAKEFLKGVPVESIWGIGPAAAAHMNKLGIKTALGFAKKTESYVNARFSKPHFEIWKELNGTRVHHVDAEKKTSYLSISKTRTFTPASKDKEYVYAQLIKNLENACVKARRYNLAAKKIIITLKTRDFKIKGLETKLQRGSSSQLELVGLVRALFEKIFEKDAFYRATGIVLTDLEDAAKKQYSLFENTRAATAKERLCAAIDSIANRVGSKMGRAAIHLLSSLKANSNIPINQLSTRTLPSSTYTIGLSRYSSFGLGNTPQKMLN